MVGWRLEAVGPESSLPVSIRDDTSAWHAIARNTRCCAFSAFVDAAGTSDTCICWHAEDRAKKYHHSATDRSGVLRIRIPAICGHTPYKILHYRYQQLHAFSQRWAEYRYLLQIFVEEPSPPNLTPCYPSAMLDPLKFLSFHRHICTLNGAKVSSWEPACVYAFLFVTKYRCRGQWSR